MYDRVCEGSVSDCKCISKYCRSNSVCCLNSTRWPSLTSTGSTGSVQQSRSSVHVQSSFHDFVAIFAQLCAIHSARESIVQAVALVALHLKWFLCCFKNHRHRHLCHLNIFERFATCIMRPCLYGAMWSYCKALALVCFSSSTFGSCAPWVADSLEFGAFTGNRETPPKDDPRNWKPSCLCQNAVHWSHLDPSTEDHHIRRLRAFKHKQVDSGLLSLL